MLRRFAMAALLACGCGGDSDDDPAAKLQGKWVVDLPNGCGEVVAFDGDRAEVDVICQLEGGGYGIQAAIGDLVFGEGSYTLTITHASCARGDQSLGGMRETAQYSFVGKQLRLASPLGTILLDRVDDSVTVEGGAVAIYGCFSAEGGFTQRAVLPI